jgi:NodT family efflux transporter outer membrane factor (OMF) lipoprotein
MRHEHHSRQGLMRPSASALLAALVLAGCSVGPAYQRPPVAQLPAFKEALPWTAADPQAAAVPDAWWTLFGDPVLDDLQKQVSINNESLKVSVAQAKAAQAAIASARASLFPTFNASLGVSRSSNALAAVKGTAYSLTGSLATWEIDLWGHLSSAVENARASYQASEDTLASARLSMQATLAQAYFALRTYEAQIQATERAVEANRQSQVITVNRYKSGVASSADVAQADSQLNSSKAQLISLRTQRAQQEHAIAVLLGKQPAEFSLAPTGQLPATVPAVPQLLPATLLQRRPDIAAAERQVAAANAQVGVARAAFFPALTLSGNAGYRNSALAGLVSSPNQFWSIGPTLALAVFDGGARQAASDSAKAALEQATANYRQVVLTAMQEVEDNLVATTNLREEVQVQADALQAARRSLEVTLNQYKAGTVSYLNVVTAQTTALTAEQTLLSAKNSQLVAIGILLKNIAGRWDPQPAAGAQARDERR